MGWVERAEMLSAASEVSGPRDECMMRPHMPWRKRGP
jgi:hypothetical protein